MKITLILLLLFIWENTFCFSNDSDCVKPKRIGEVIYESRGPVKIESDSSYFDGYLVFEVHKNSSENFNIGDSTISTLEIFYIDSLSDLPKNENRIFYSTTSYRYAFADEMPYDTGNGNNKNVEMVLDSKDENFQKLKTFYNKYIELKENFGAKFFLSEIKTSAIFDTSSAPLLKLDDESVSYFIFRVKFYGAIFSYKSKVYVLRQTLREKDKYIYYDVRKYFLPISQSYFFEPIDEKIVLRNGYTKSEWFPDYLYKKCK